MNIMSSVRNVAVLAVVAILAAGCGGGDKGYVKKTGVGPGMNAQGEVVDSTLVESGYGEYVKSHDNWEGEITGKPAPDSKFTQLKIGMPMTQVIVLLGQPTATGSHMTGKAWIPFYFGSDRHRVEFVYKGQGRLLFAGGTFGDFTSGNLIWIIYAKNEPGII